jgi:hypothetical protein
LLFSEVLLLAMDSFVKLLSSDNVDSSVPFWQDSQFVLSPPEEQEIEEVQDVQVTTHVKPKGRKSRTRFFSKKEDTHLCESWLEVSLDGAQSTEQHRSTYWERIHEYFHKHKTFKSDRSMKALSNRWGTILEFTNRFCGCHT